MIECIRKWLITLLTPKPPVPSPIQPRHQQNMNLELIVQWRGVITHRFPVRISPAGTITLKDACGLNVANGDRGTLTVILPDRLVAADKLAHLAEIDMATVIEALD